MLARCDSLPTKTNTKQSAYFWLERKVLLSPLISLAVAGGAAYFVLSVRKAGTVAARTGEVAGWLAVEEGAVLAILSTLVTLETELWRGTVLGRLERNP